MYTNIIPFGDQILLEYHTHDVGLSNCMAEAHEIKMLCVQQSFLVHRLETNHAEE